MEKSTDGKNEIIDENIVLEFYDLPTRKIKITRFFEVARYLTENKLWEKVEKKLVENQIIGERIILDSILGNAVKVVIDENLNTLKKMPKKTADKIAYEVMGCGCTPDKPKPGPSSGGERG